MVTALINTVFAWLYDKYADIKERSFPTDPVWANGHDSNLPECVEDCDMNDADDSFMSRTMSTVATTARTLEQGIESRVKQLGVPVDDLKDKAFDLANEAIAKGQQVIHHVHGEAQKAGQEVVDEVKDEGRSNKHVVRNIADR